MLNKTHRIPDPFAFAFDYLEENIKDEMTPYFQ